MKKFHLSSQAMKALYPPMSDAFDKTVQRTLKDLENGKEHPIVKRKISAALIMAMILILVTLGVAYALTQSNLLQSIFGSGVKVPEGLEEVVSKPEATVTTPDAKVTLSEYLFDGERLHLFWSIANQTDRQIMVTMTPFMINGMKGYTEIMDASAKGMPLIQTDNIHGWGQILGGDADGCALPGNVNYYSCFSNPGEYAQGYHIFKKGEALEITGDLYIWELLSKPDPVIPDNILNMLSLANTATTDNPKVREGLFDAKALHGIPTDRSGLCGLNWLILNDNYDDLSLGIDICTPEENLKSYEANGWARLIYQQPVKFSITLDTKGIKRAKPVKTAFETKDFILNIKQLAYMPTGGTLKLHIEPKANASAQNSSLPSYMVMDADTKELLGVTSAMDVSSIGQNGYIDAEETMVLTPVPNGMPKAILIVPVVSNPNWDNKTKIFDPKAAQDQNSKTFYIYDMENAVKVELEWQ